MFACLAVFVGGCTAAMAQAVYIAFADQPPHPHLATLVDQSLILRQDFAQDEPRFTLLETIREYALERLAASGEAPAIRQRFAACLLDLAEQAELSQNPGGPA